MSYLILPGDVLARLYDQPIALNRSHSGLSRIVAAWYARDGDRPFDMLAGRTGGKSGSFPMARSVTHEMGYAHRTPFGGVEWTDLPEWARSNNPAYSLLAISLNTGSTSSSQVALTQQGSGWAGAQIYEGNGSSNVIRGGTTRDTTSAGSTGIAVPIGRRYCAVAVDQSTSIQCAVNGQLDTAGSPAGSYNATQSRLTSGDTTRPVWLMLCWRRALSQGEMVEYSARPDQLFKREPEVSYFLFQAASGGGPTYTLDADAGTYALTGTAAGLTAARTIAADAGTYAVTGTAAALTAGRAIAADAGTYSLTGTDAALTAARTIAADAGTYTLTGTAADLEYSGAGGPTYTLAADAGTYAVTGTDAALTAARTIAADAGTYSISGTDAALSYGRFIAADAGTYSLTGTDAALSRTRALVADPGTYTLTGTAADFAYSGAPAVEQQQATGGWPEPTKRRKRKPTKDPAEEGRRELRETLRKIARGPQEPAADAPAPDAQPAPNMPAAADSAPLPADVLPDLSAMLGGRMLGQINDVLPAVQSADAAQLLAENAMLRRQLQRQKAAFVLLLNG